MTKYVSAAMLCLISLSASAVSYKGDVNADGKVDMADMADMAKAITNDDTRKELFDLNNSGSIDDADLHYLANLIINEKFIEDTGLNVGIGDWDDSGEDFGGSVGGTRSASSSSNSVFSTRSSGNAYIEAEITHQPDKNRQFINLYLKGDVAGKSAVLCGFKYSKDFQIDLNDVTFNTGSDGKHSVYGTPVILDRGWEGKTLKFIIFSPKLSKLESTDGKVLLASFEYKFYGDNNLQQNVDFQGCQTIDINGNTDVMADRGQGNYWKYIPVESVRMDPRDVPETIYAGTRFPLYASVNPENATERGYEYTSSNPEIAAVEGDWINVLKPGNFTITMTSKAYGNKSTSLDFTAVARLVESISLNHQNVEIFKGASLQLSASVSPDNATDTSVTWSVDNPSVASVDDNGLVAGLSAGSAIVTATANDGSNLSASCSVKVVPKYVTEITLDKTEISLIEGDTHQLTATVTPDDATNKDLVWTSDDETIAKVSNTGLVTLVNAGETIVRVRTTDGSELEATCLVKGSKSGIENLFENDKPCDVYNINGILIRKSISKEELLELPHGLYIITKEGKAIKIEI